jgi:hypothetical protein
MDFRKDSPCFALLKAIVNFEKTFKLMTYTILSGFLLIWQVSKVVKSSRKHIQVQNLQFPHNQNP